MSAYPRVSLDSAGKKIEMASLHQRTGSKRNFKVLNCIKLINPDGRRNGEEIARHTRRYFKMDHFKKQNLLEYDEVQDYFSKHICM
jgi:hypothetical protein